MELNGDQLEKLLGKADWIYDLDLNMHIPVCSAKVRSGRRCGLGPLTGDSVDTGRCDNEAGRHAEG